MFFRALPIRRPALAGIVLAMAGSLHAQLATKSPFMPPQAAGAGAATAGAALEFRGYMTTGGETLYCVYNPTRKAGLWVKLNERSPEFDVTVKQHNLEKSTLVVEYQGKTLTLAEHTSKVISSGAAAQTLPPPPPAANVAPAVTQTVVLNPTPADEQRRLDAVAAEVARRRALREQATQQMSQGTAPPATPPGPIAPSPQPGMPGPNPPPGQRGRGPAQVLPRQQ